MVTDVGISIGEIEISAFAGFAIGGPVGAIVGGVGSLLFTYVIDIHEDENGRTFRDEGKDWGYGAYKSITGKEDK